MVVSDKGYRAAVKYVQDAIKYARKCTEMVDGSDIDLEIDADLEVARAEGAKMALGLLLGTEAPEEDEEEDDD